MTISSTDPVAQYHPVEMTEALEQRQKPTTFLKDMFVKNKPPSNKYAFSLDKIFGGRQVAGFVNRQGGPHRVGKAGMENTLHIAPYMYEEYPYTPSDVDIRTLGHHVYEDGSTALDRLVAGWMADLEDRFIRAEEKQVSDALINGVINITGNGVNYQLDFNQKAAHLITLSGTDRWTESTADKMALIGAWVQMIIRTGAPAPRNLVADPLAMGLLLDDTAVVNKLDNRNIDVGSIKYETIESQNASYHGTLRGIGWALDLYTYQGVYDIGSTTYAHMPDYNLILGSPAAKFDMYYGKIENFGADNFTAQRFASRWTKENGKGGFVTLESSPMAALVQTDAFVRVDVTSAS